MTWVHETRHFFTIEDGAGRTYPGEGHWWDTAEEAGLFIGDSSYFAGFHIVEHYSTDLSRKL